MQERRRPPAIDLMYTLGLGPDPWQLRVLESHDPWMLLNCSRQAGKSTVVAALALAEAMFKSGSLVVILSRSLRQSGELLRLVVDMHRRLGAPMKVRRNAHELTLANHSRVVCLPCREETIRGLAHVDVLIIDEAARVPDDVYRAVRPMLAVSRGRLICLSTPFGKRGFFWDAWARGGDDWARIEVPAQLIPRITPAFLEAERRAHGEAAFRQEYCCSFEAMEGLVFPDFARCVVPSLPAHVIAPPLPAGVMVPPLPAGERGRGEGSGSQRWVGGLDFGFRNPFAAIWGTVDRDGILWLTGEHYCRNKPISYHATRLPRKVMWYADPSGANERAELRLLDFKVAKGSNALSAGLQRISARLAAGTLKVVEGACPDLLAEAALYRYSDDPAECHAEAPLDEHNHAISALRYLLSRLDARRMTARLAPTAEPTPEPDDDHAAPPPPPKERRWLRLDNEELWTPWWPSDP
jgi:Terminase large subunit, T4likevirus-type, N-terminal